MSYLTEFPPFLTEGMPAIPASWEDISWHNDAAPSFNAKKFADAYLHVWVDAQSAEHREIPGGRYTVNLASEHSSDWPNLLNTDDFGKVLELVELIDFETALAWVFCDEMRDTLTAAELAVVNERNEMESRKGICHSHDMCDANEVMISALKFFGLDRVADDDATTEKETDLSNAAWDAARMAGFDGDALISGIL